MITGERLSEVLCFSKDALQGEIAKAASSLSAIDRRLSELRLDEALAWSRYGRSAPDTRLAGSADEIRRVAARRQERVEQGIAAIREVEAEAAALRPSREAARERLAQARAAFEEAERAARNAAANHPDMARLRDAAAAVRLHRQRIGRWADESGPEARSVLDSLDADPAFSYLWSRKFGTDEYRAGPLTRALDRWLARRCGYAQAAALRSGILGYGESAKGWIDECDAALERIVALARRTAEKAMEGLDGPRSALAEALNEEDALARKADALDATAREALEAVIEIALGKDDDHAGMSASLVSLITQERVGAMERASTSPGGPDTATSFEIDGIVRERISLSMEADGLRVQIAFAAARLKAIEDVTIRLALRKWDTADVRFSLDARSMIGHDLSSGRLSAEAAWAEIEASLETSGKKAHMAARTPSA